MMKKLLTAGTAVAFISGSVGAMDGMSAYVGLDGGYNRYTYTSGQAVDTTAAAAGVTPSKANTSLGLMLGGKFHENFGAELGYTLHSSKKAVDSGANQSNVKGTNMYADLLGYVPVADKVEVLGALGVGRFKAKNTNNAGATASKNKTGFRIGAGLKYDFTPEVAARLMVRYQKVGGAAVVKDVTGATLGLTYSFM